MTDFAWFWSFNLNNKRAQVSVYIVIECTVCISRDRLIGTAGTSKLQGCSQRRIPINWRGPMTNSVRSLPYM